MADAEPTRVRSNQRRRTRKDLLQAAARLMKEGRKPSLEEIAEEALVSRATAYRYFPGLDALLLEASLDVAVPEPGALFRGAPTDDPVARVEMVDVALEAMIRANEPALRMLLAHALQPSEHNSPARQNRRSPLIEAALIPVAGQFVPAALDRLAKALALVVGTEAHIVFKDVLQIDEDEARAIRLWMIRSLVAAARSNAT
jgi:AcrR family transcriptional regulator